MSVSARSRSGLVVCAVGWSGCTVALDLPPGAQLACTSDADCPSDYTCSTEPVTSVNGASARQCVPSSSDCSDPDGTVCIDDVREDNDNTAQAISKNYLGKGTHELISCPSSTGTGDDEDWFRIYLSIETQVDVTIDGGDVSDLDLALYSQATGSAVDSSSSFSSQEAVGSSRKLHSRREDTSS